MKFNTFTKNTLRDTKVAGFTLIELLVVIAIIGILSSIVLASLSTARSKANDSKVQEQLNSVKSAMEIYYSANNSYSSSTAAAVNQDAVTIATAGLTGIPFSDTSSGLASLLGASSTVNWPSGTTVSANITANGTAYAISALLSTAKVQCIDSTGVSKQESSNLASGITQCP